MKTRTEICAQIKELNKQLEVIDNLIKVGVSEKNASYFQTLNDVYTFTSGYRMGEIVEYQVSGTTLFKDDRRKWYKNKKYKESHGSIIFNFSKKAIVKLCKLLKNYHDNEKMIDYYRDVLRVSETLKSFEQEKQLEQNKKLIRVYLDKRLVLYEEVRFLFKTAYNKELSVVFLKNAVI